MSENKYSREEILAAEKALRLLYDELKAGKGIFPSWIKDVFHKHMNKTTELFKQLK